MKKGIQVAIIESISRKDLYENRREGHALCKIFDMIGIRYKFFECFGKKELIDAIHEVVKLKSLNYLHFSMHGSKDAIYLMNEECINWDEFHSLFWPVLKGKVLTFSSCEVGQGVKKLFQLKSTFCQAIIAPKDEIYWDEGLIAYSNLYYLALKEDNILNDLKKINQIIGEKKFFSIDNRNTIMLL